jgi:hypothetical protein
LHVFFVALHKSGSTVLLCSARVKK